MGIFTVIKRSLGLGEESYDELFNAEDATVVPRRHQDIEPVQDGEQQEAAPQVPVEEELTIPVDVIFTHVVKTFNESLPGFLARSVDEEAQRRALRELLDEDVKRYLADLQSRALDACNRRWERDRQSLNAQISSLTASHKSIEDNLAEKTKAVLSAERQRRAVNERVRDLENQIARLEAEKEQYELENRSLLNKMRMMGVTGEAPAGTDEDAAKEVQELKGALETANALVAELKSKEEESAHALEVIQEQLRASHTANEELQEAVKTLQLKSDMSDSMFSDLNERAAAAGQEVSQRQEQVEKLAAQLQEAVRELDETRAERDELARQLEDANENLTIAAEIATQVEHLKKMQESKTSVINELNIEIKKRDDRINALEAQEKSLRSTIESNLRESAATIEQLNEQLKEAAAVQNEKTSKRRKTSQSKISAIADDLDNTDWLVSTPPAGTSIKTSGVSDEEFGYQEPQRKNTPGNSSQMSLFESM